MAWRGGAPTGGQAARTERGQSEVLGMIMLLTMVLVSSVLVALAGGALISDLQSRAQTAQATDSMAVVESKMTQTVATEEARSLSAIGGPGGEPVVRERGTATIAWVDGPNASLPPAASSCRVDVDPLGAIELEHGGNTVAYQAGGVWRRTAAGSVVESAPDVGYEDGRLQLDIVQVGADDARNASVASVDTAATDRLATRLERAARCGGGRTMVLRIESRYHEGWYDHLRRALDGDGANGTVEHDEGAGVVTARVENVRSPDGPSRVRPVGSATLVETGVDDDRVAHGEEPITFETTLQSTGDAIAGQPITLAIDAGDETITETTTVDLPRDGRRTVSVSIDSGEYASRIDPGRRYSYELRAGDTPIATGGSVYVGTPEPTFTLGEPTPELDTGTLTLSVPVTNEGVTASTETVSLQLNARDDPRGRGYRIDPVSVERAAGESARVSWQLSAERLASGHHRYRIGTGDDAVSGSVTVPATDVETTGSELTFERSRTVNVTVLGPEVSVEQEAEYTDDGIVGGNRSAGNWERTGRGNASLDWPGRTVLYGPGTEPSYDASGGWVPESGSLECVRHGESACQRYGFPNTAAFQWNDDGGYAFDWRVDPAGNWSWQGAGTFGEDDVYEKFWWPVTLDVTLEDTNSGRTERRSPWRDQQPPESDHLNQYRDGTASRTHSLSVDAGTRLSFEATSWSCESGWTHVARDSYGGGTTANGGDTTGGNGGLEPTDWRGLWEHYDCTDIGEPLFQVDSSTETNPENVRSRDAVANTIPELRAGNPRQRSADELLGDQFVERHDNGTGVLDLTEDEFVFLFEITGEPGPNVTADEFFEQAHAADGPGDPNFNDLIVLVELGDNRSPGAGVPRPLSPTVDTGDGDSDGDAATSEPGTVVTGGAIGPADADEGIGIQVDADSVVVG